MATCRGDAQLAYSLAFLKANFSAEYMAVYLKPGLRGWYDRDGYHSYQIECEELGIDVVAQDDGGFSFLLRNGKAMRI